MKFSTLTPLPLPDFLNGDCLQNAINLNQQIGQLKRNQKSLEQDKEQAKTDLTDPIKPQNYQLRYVNLFSKELEIRKNIQDWFKEYRKQHRANHDNIFQQLQDMETMLRSNLIKLGFPQERNLHLYHRDYANLKATELAAKSYDPQPENQNTAMIGWLKDEIAKLRQGL